MKPEKNKNSNRKKTGDKNKQNIIRNHEQKKNMIS